MSSPALKKELVITWSCLAATVVALLLVYRHAAAVAIDGPHDVMAFFQAGGIAALITALAYGSVVYLLARIGYLKRRGNTGPALDQLEARYMGGGASLPRLCVLIPSYKEELRVVRQTMLSATLAVYGPRRVVVLIDDPQKSTARDREALAKTRELIARCHRRFHGAATHVRAAYSDFLVRTQRGSVPSVADETNRLADLYDFAGEFVASLARFDAPPELCKAESFLNARIIGPAAERHRAKALALRRADGSSLAEVELGFRRLIGQLSVEITSFERKKYRNLSHAPNKAMNLNSYIGLIGKSYRVVANGDIPALEECSSARADLIVPDAKYLLTLDADSMVLPQYLLKLVDLMEHDDRMAVAQTPYSHIPGEAGALERAAGAQTDLQYVVHQGSTAANATYWVGANALLRVAALRSIATTLRERDIEVPVFIQDRTVIEDTGSTIDLIRGGWTLHNHPERLAYSATPPDFGSLIIQRRRWSNGGLIIFSDLVSHALSRDGTRPTAAELFLRAHYLCGPALTGFSVLLLLVLPFDGALLSAWLPATVLPYYALYARDARRIDYRWSELLNVYTLNLMLLPITLAGVSRSIQQALTGRKSSFGRTPKTEERTSVQPLHLLLQAGLIVAVAVVAGRSAAGGHPYLTAYWALNFVLLLAGFRTLIGVRAAWADMVMQLPWLQRAPLLRRPRSAAAPQATSLPLEFPTGEACNASSFTEVRGQRARQRSKGRRS